MVIFSRKIIQKAFECYYNQLDPTTIRWLMIKNAFCYLLNGQCIACCIWAICWSQAPHLYFEIFCIDIQIWIYFRYLKKKLWVGIYKWSNWSKIWDFWCFHFALSRIAVAVVGLDCSGYIQSKDNPKSFRMVPQPARCDHPMVTYDKKWILLPTERAVHCMLYLSDLLVTSFNVIFWDFLHKYSNMDIFSIF